MIAIKKAADFSRLPLFIRRKLERIIQVRVWMDENINSGYLLPSL